MTEKNCIISITLVLATCIAMIFIAPTYNWSGFSEAATSMLRAFSVIAGITASVALCHETVGIWKAEQPTM